MIIIAAIINLSNWYLTLPVGKPDTIHQPALDSYSSEWFHLEGDGLVFKANAGGATTAHSAFPRSELREMINSKNASWSNSKGISTLEGEYSIKSNLVKRNQVVFNQVHDSSSDVFECAFDNGKLVILYNNKKSVVVLEPNYVEGTKFTSKIEAKNGKFYVSYNGVLKATISKKSKGDYFKTGAYLQTNPSKYGESPQASAEVTIYSLQVVHE